MKDKSGYSRIIKVMQRQSRSDDISGMRIATMKTSTSIICDGLTLLTDDYVKLDGTETLKAGDTVLMCRIEEQYILMGKVI